jgi:UDP-GlcNAc:undecaprenyl-phosphate GlcNAc-1-phosphate transferase
MALVAFFVSAALSASLIPWVIIFAHKKKMFDEHNERKIHNGDIPRLGGVGIVLAFAATVILIGFLQSKFYNVYNQNLGTLPFLASGVMIFLLGLLDDIYGIRAIIKLAVQLMVAIIIMAFGFVFRKISVPWGTGLLDLGLFSYPLTLLWIIGITNSINLIDGMDGLAGGVTFISAFAFALFALAAKNMISAEICFAIMGSVAGFLLYNLPPAKIFMGDAGSLFLGYMMALLPLLGQRIEGVGVGVVSSSLILSIPILDTFMAIYRRKKAGVSFFTADKGHLHHRLLDKGYTCSKSLLVIYGMNASLALAALSSLYLPVGWSMVVKVLSLVIIFVFFVLVNTKDKLMPGSITHFLTERFSSRSHD